MGFQLVGISQIAAYYEECFLCSAVGYCRGSSFHVKTHLPCVGMKKIPVDQSEMSFSLLQTVAAELLDQISTIQAGFPVYKQTVEQYISTLACFQEEIDDLKKANTEKDATIREFEEAKLQMTVDLQDLDKRVSGMLGKYNGVGVTVVSGADQAKAKEARAEVKLNKMLVPYALVHLSS